MKNTKTSSLFLMLAMTSAYQIEASYNNNSGDEQSLARARPRQQAVARPAAANNTNGTVSRIDPRTRISAIDTSKDLTIDCNKILLFLRDWALNKHRGNLTFVFNPEQALDDISDGLKTHDGVRKLLENENDICARLHTAMQTEGISGRTTLAILGEAFPDYADSKGIVNLDSIRFDIVDAIQEIAESATHRYVNLNRMDSIEYGNAGNRLEGFNYGDGHDAVNPFSAALLLVDGPQIEEIDEDGQPVGDNEHRPMVAPDFLGDITQQINSGSAKRDLDAEVGFDNNSNNILAHPLGVMTGVAVYANNFNFFTAITLMKVVHDAINDMTKIYSEASRDIQHKDNNAQTWYDNLSGKYSEVKLGLDKKDFTNTHTKAWSAGYKQIYCPIETYKRIHRAQNNPDRINNKEFLAQQEWEVLRNVGKIKYYDSIVTPLVYAGINVGLIAGLRKAFDHKMMKNRYVWLATLSAATTIQFAGGQFLCNAYSRFKEGQFDGYANRIATDEVLVARKAAFNDQSRNKDIATYPTAVRRATWIEAKLQARAKERMAATN